MTEAELYWLAGWLEGEGSFFAKVTKPQNPRHRSRVALSITGSSIDRPVLDRVLGIAGGRLQGPYCRGHNKPYWTWAVAQRSATVHLMRRLMPLMSPRRQRQIALALRRHKQFAIGKPPTAHGTTWRYSSRKCRCKRCCKAWATYLRGWRAKRALVASA